MSLLTREFKVKLGWKSLMLELEEEITNERILGVSSQVLLINLKFQKLDSIKVKLNIVVVLRDGMFLCLGNLREHINFEVWANPSQHHARIVRPSVSSLHPEVHVYKADCCSIA